MLSWLKRKNETGAADGDGVGQKPLVWRVFTPEGMLLGSFESVGARPGAAGLTSPTLPSLVGQLQDEGYALPGEATAQLAWDAVYNLLDNKSYAASIDQLELPPCGEYVPELQSRNTLIDESFVVAINCWRDSLGRKPVSVVRTGGVLHVDGRLSLLAREAWETAEQVARFARRPVSERDDGTNRMRWGQIRRSAIAAKARMDQFLYKSVVLTPDSIQINMRTTDVGGTRVVEIMPGFDGAPNDWLRVFDSYKSIPDRYDINTPDGVVQVLVTPQVRTVLDSIRRLEGRRVAGTRAEAFLVNPMAALGEDASAVIDPEQFEKARVDSGILFEHFTARVERDSTGYPEKIGLFIESPNAQRDVTTEERFFSDNAELDGFVRAAERAMSKDRQLLGWEGYDFELLGDTPQQVSILKEALEERSRPRILVRYSDVYDLSAYTSRVEDIGREKPYYSPYIAKKAAEWWPENLVNVMVYTPEGETEAVAIPVSVVMQEQMEARLQDAQQKGLTQIEMPGFPKPIPVQEASDLLRAFKGAKEGAEIGGWQPPKALKDEGSDKTRPGKPLHLLLKPNISTIDYEEARQDILSAFVKKPELPKALKSSTELLPHQLEGVAKLQHLFNHAPTHCRGALMADDMGLGKTLQLLTFLAWAFERNPELPPALIVAPVSLLENWVEEITKFFEPDSLPILIAYGDELAKLKVPRASIEEQLRRENLVRFLQPKWRGSSKVVLTTYETLRDYEFTFAAESWSVMACDEAQKIKNPNAMVTRAAKKQRVIFKIACTGTPVENTLADLWCLFDFIQAGLLGALNDFGKRYRKPIEAETDEEKARVKELRKLIEPQILRRLKSEVANLPTKHQVLSRVPISNYQRMLYTQAVNSYKGGVEGKVPSPFKNHLGLLHYLRTICTTPHMPGLGKFKPQVLQQCRYDAPKLNWLLETLETIQYKNEKVIVFCEFREMQQMLAYYVQEVFRFTPDIINGDVTASAKHIASRQKRIRAFQEKSGFGVVILSPVAVGYGVNVQEANHVIHYTRNWNPAKEDQATDRAYRIGQTREVWVYCPTVYADDFTTFDEKLDQLLTAKRKLAGDMLNGSGAVIPGDWDLPDIVPNGHSDATFNRAITMDDVLRMEWDYFECLVAALWQKKGYRTVYRTPARDEGVDVVAFTGTKGDLIQCKSSGVEDTMLGDQGIKDVLSGAAEYSARHPAVVFDKWAATNQYFNATAHDRARKHAVTLINQKDIEDLLAKHPVTRAEVERFLCTEWDAAA